MPELDHLIFASPDLQEGVRLIEELTGAAAQPGGPHPGVGTHNALLTFNSSTYFEVIGIDPDQPEPERPRPFGLDDRRPPHLAGYAIHPSEDETLEDVVEMMRASGFDPGEIRSMSRLRPDGTEIAWRLTAVGARPPADGVLPFVIDWGDQPSPALSLPPMGTLESVSIHHGDADVRRAAEALGLGVETVEGTPAVVAMVRTAKGVIQLP